MNIGDTIRVLRDEPCGADIKAGTCGVVLSFLDEDGLVASFSGGKRWAFQFKDVEVVNVEDVFSSLTTDLRDIVTDLTALAACYEPSDPLPGTPLELPSSSVSDSDADAAASMSNAEGYDEDDHDCSAFDDDDECDECPDEDDTPHHHDESGARQTLPHLLLTDTHGDSLHAIDTRSMVPPEGFPAVALSFRIGYQSGETLHAHLTESQAIALTAFLLKTFMRSQ